MLVESRQPAARQKGITLSMQAEPTIIVVDHVADYVQKMIDNLLSNALKYTAEGGTVTLSARQQGQQLLLTVSDDGQGIHPDDLPHIFEPFYQSRHTSTAPGTGIGLAFCREIANASQATISAKSALGEDTTFTIVMPLRQRNITTTPTSKPTTPTPPTNDILPPTRRSYSRRGGG